MEPLWSPVVAIGGNRSQIALACNRRNQAKTVAVSCDPFRFERMVKVVPLRGMEGVTSLAPQRDEAPRLRDIDSIVSLFADDATVIDEGEERHGTAEIRAWQTGAASKYTYTTEITSTEALGPDRYLVTGRLTGNFPGGTADLKWDFTIAGQHITRLTIAP
jgi:SnoaL-like domain